MTPWHYPSGSNDEASKKALLPEPPVMAPPPPPVPPPSGRLVGCVLLGFGKKRKLWELWQFYGSFMVQNMVVSLKKKTTSIHPLRPLNCETRRSRIKDANNQHCCAKSPTQRVKLNNLSSNKTQMASTTKVHNKNPHTSPLKAAEAVFSWGLLPVNNLPGQLPRRRPRPRWAAWARTHRSSPRALWRPRKSRRSRRWAATHCPSSQVGQWLGWLGCVGGWGGETVFLAWDEQWVITFFLTGALAEWWRWLASTAGSASAFQWVFSILQWVEESAGSQTCLETV